MRNNSIYRISFYPPYFVTILIINCFSNLFKGKREVPILVSPPFSGVKLKLANEFFHWMYCCNISIGNRF